MLLSFNGLPRLCWLIAASRIRQAETYFVQSGRTLVRVVALARAQGKDAVGACYLRATADQISSLRPKNHVISLMRRM